MTVLRYLLFPVSILYGAVVFLRNRFFDWGIFESEPGEIKTIVIGNLSLGGTGKTPHLEFVVRKLQDKTSFAILSRGYGRKSKGYVLADKNSTAQTIGDEPMQLYAKFPEVPLVVCENRLDGIRQIKKCFPETKVVLLDDGLQHRRLKGDLNILLTDYSNPFFSDMMLPSGTLRDNRQEKRRADIIIITKCPLRLNVDEREEFITRINPVVHQRIFFSTLQYENPVQFSGPVSTLEQGDPVMGFSGIAKPDSFEKFLSARYSLKKFKTFPDHHPFAARDYQDLHKVYVTFGGLLGGLVTTEKDASRINTIAMPDEMKNLPMFFIPVKVQLQDNMEEFEKAISGILR